MAHESRRKQRSCHLQRHLPLGRCRRLPVLWGWREGGCAPELQHDLPAAAVWRKAWHGGRLQPEGRILCAAAVHLPSPQLAFPGEYSGDCRGQSLWTGKHPLLCHFVCFECRGVRHGDGHPLHLDGALLDGLHQCRHGHICLPRARPVPLCCGSLGPAHSRAVALAKAGLTPGLWGAARFARRRRRGGGRLLHPCGPAVTSRLCCPWLRTTFTTASAGGGRGGEMAA
mmetsp:Transcript_11926/g.33589  ORF Transcript_11926/g.33589 Transcript_11926/m.33589 type:complete len:227 (+) Transcript_11926:1058-1738(+)